jgi:hypothetical protein
MGKRDKGGAEAELDRSVEQLLKKVAKWFYTKRAL